MWKAVLIAQLVIPLVLGIPLLILGDNFFTRKDWLSNWWAHA